MRVGLFSLMFSLMSGATSGALVVGLAAGTALAGDPVWVQPSGKDLFEGYVNDPDKNVSGAHCWDREHCLLVADEIVAIEPIRLNIPEGGTPTFAVPEDDSAEGHHHALLFADICENIADEDDCSEVDLEAIAGDSGKVVMSGSLGTSKNKGKLKPERWFLASYEVQADGSALPDTLRKQTDTNALKTVFTQHPLLRKSIDLPLQCDGLNIEGLGLIDDRLFFGLRAPIDREAATALILEVSDQVLEDPSLAVDDTILHRPVFRDTNGAPLPNTGIRALETFGSGFLIATGDSRVGVPKKLDKVRERCLKKTKSDALPNMRPKTEDQVAPRIWLWEIGKDPIELYRFKGDWAKEKLEGIALLSEDREAGTIDLLLTIDGRDDPSGLALLVGLPRP